MADSSVPVQPASNTPAPQPIGIRTITTERLDANGNPLQIQGVVWLDDTGRPMTPMTAAQADTIILLLQQLVSIQSQATGNTG